jgi:CubicO group peptidase (beta-lactamase class C family)
VAILKDGHSLYQRGYGSANLEDNIPLASNTMFHLDSGSKPFTALSILLLEKDGKLHLDDPVRKYIPELPDYGQPITLRHLLGHTSGLRDALELDFLSGKNQDDSAVAADLFELIYRQKDLNFRPGEEWMYSNTNYWLLGQLVTRLSGKSFRRFTDERIFGPLGMSHTHFYDRGELVPHRAAGYKKTEDGYRNVPEDIFYTMGAGGVWTTLGDMVRWDAVFYQPPSEFASFIARLQEPVVLNNGQKVEWAIGNLILEPWGKYRVVTQAGTFWGSRAELIRLPDQHFSVFCLCNRGDSDPARFARRVAKLYYPDGPVEVSPEPAGPQTFSGQLDQEELPQLAGRYRCEDLDTVYQVKVDGYFLQINFGHNEVRLHPGKLHQFLNDWISITTTPDGFVLHAQRAKNFRFKKLP